MSTPKSDSLRTQQYERRKQVCEWLSTHNDWHTIYEISIGIGMNRQNIINTVEWLERKKKY